MVKELSLVVIGSNWQSLVVIGRLIRLDIQWRGRLHSYMCGWDGIGLGGYRRSEVVFSANNIKNWTVECLYLVSERNTVSYVVFRHKTVLGSFLLWRSDISQNSFFLQVDRVCHC